MRKDTYHLGWLFILYFMTLRQPRTGSPGHGVGWLHSRDRTACSKGFSLPAFGDPANAVAPDPSRIRAAPIHQGSISHHLPSHCLPKRLEAPKPKSVNKILSFPRMSSSARHGAAPLRPVPRSKGCITCTSRKTRCGSLTSIRHRLMKAPLTRVFRWQTAHVSGMRATQAGLSRLPSRRICLHERRVEGPRRSFSYR